MPNRRKSTYRVVVVVEKGIAAPNIMLDFAAAFEELGHSVFLIDFRLLETMASDEEKIAYFENIRKELKQFEPDFAVGYGNSVFISLPPNDPERHFFEEMEINYISLFFDNPLLTGFISSMLTLHSPRYTVFIWDRNHLAEFRRQHKKEAFYLPLATNPKVFRPLAPEPEFEADVGFIGSVSTTADYDLERIQNGWHEWLVSFARNIVDAVRRHPGVTVTEIIHAFRDGFPDETRKALDDFSRRDDYTSFILSLYDEIGARDRMDAIRLLPDDLRVHVYGGPGWNRLSKPGLHLKGPVDYHRTAPLVYNSARINLNVTGSQLSAAVNQRVFDVAACGAFLLTDYRTALDELFVVGREVACYRNLNELKQLTDYYRSHPDLRLEIAARGRQRVLAEHTYCHRAQRIIDLFQYRASY
ncbi:MAG: glycosyltransferase [Pseudomonadota bacterium]